MSRQGGEVQEEVAMGIIVEVTDGVSFGISCVGVTIMGAGGLCNRRYLAPCLCLYGKDS